MLELLNGAEDCPLRRYQPPKQVHAAQDVVAVIKAENTDILVKGGLAASS